ncbi:MAG: 2-C-methyl-D-erythritol 4-phosphate cytidylyltransferase [Bacillota bacterium]
MKIALLIAAAGKGSRMNSKTKKQFIHLNKRPVLWHTIKAFTGLDFEFAQINIMVAAEDIDYTRNEVLKDIDLDRDVVNIKHGGNSRKETVCLGLESFNPDVDYVLIHDGARPFVKSEIIYKLISKLKKFNAVIPGVAVKDTIKIKSAEGLVAKTLDRDDLIAVQTPQAFLYSLIKKVHLQSKNSGIKVYDDASLVEDIGEEVAIIDGDYNNIKITTQEDLVKAKILLKERRWKS